MYLELQHEHAYICIFVLRVSKNGWNILENHTGYQTHSEEGTHIIWYILSMTYYYKYGRYNSIRIPLYLISCLYLKWLSLPNYYFIISKVEERRPWIYNDYLKSYNETCWLIFMKTVICMHRSRISAFEPFHLVGTSSNIARLVVNIGAPLTNIRRRQDSLLPVPTEVSLLRISSSLEFWNSFAMSSANLPNTGRVTIFL